MKQSLPQNVQILWLPYSCKLKNNLHWSEDLNLGILDSFAAQDFTKDPSSVANVALNFAHLVPEDQLEAWLFSVIFLSQTKLFLIFFFFFLKQNEVSQDS